MLVCASSHSKYKSILGKNKHSTKLLQLEPLQSNGYDCGLWVLAQIAAVLRGYDITNMREDNMHSFRRYLQSLVLSIPIPDM